MRAFLKKYDRCFASIFVAICSLLVWCLVGELRWTYRPWHFRMSAGDSHQIFGTMYWLEVSAKALGLMAVIWAVVAVLRTRTLFAKIVLAGAVLVFLISFAP